MSGGGDYGGLVLALVLLFVVGFFIPLVVSSFVDTSVPSDNSFLSPFTDFIDNGVTVLGIHINPFGIFGPKFKTFILDQFNAFTYIPNIISLPIVVFIFVMFVYAILKLVPFVG